MTRHTAFKPEEFGVEAPTSIGVIKYAGTAARGTYEFTAYHLEDWVVKENGVLAVTYATAQGQKRTRVVAPGRWIDFEEREVIEE